MSEITPERASKVLDRAVDITQLICLLGGALGVLSGAQLVVDDNMAGWAVGGGVAILAALSFLVACWARAWQLSLERTAPPV